MGNKQRSILIIASIGVSSFFSGCETGVPPEEVAQVYYNLGNAYFELEEFGPAATAYLNALALDDSLPQAGYNLARAYVEAGDYEKGLEALTDLLEEDPANNLIMSTIGWTHYLQGDYELALETFELMLERTPTDEHGLYNAAVLSLKLEKKEAALGYFQRLHKETGEVEILYRIASIQLDLQRWGDAIDTLSRYIDERPEDADAYYDLGIAFAAERYYGRALEALEAGIELKKNDPLFYFEKAVILILYIENIDEGLKALDAAVKAGFKDLERVRALLAADELLFYDELERFFEEKNLLPEELPAEEPAGGDAAGSGAADEDSPDGEEPGAGESGTDDRPETEDSRD